MRHFLRIVWAVTCAGIFTGGAGAAEPAEAPIKVFAAGSLTGALTAIIKAYQEKTGVHVQAEFGPAGLLRERIEGGERPDIFASANMAHPQAAIKAGS
jgi:molybdate transport system substrate-binding protein